MRKQNIIKFIKGCLLTLNLLEVVDSTMDAETLYSLGIALIFTGILIVLVAIVLIFLSNINETGKVKGGGAIIIGPFPIIFGTDKESVKIILLLSITLIVLLIALTITFYLLSR
jgi:uncharacterized protein (TIGR00304 family)